jgi:serine/threonine protein phosphatase PrpC
MSTVIAGAATDVGKVREHNEDSHCMDADAQVFIVADGMGGHAAGEVASGAAVKLTRAAWTSQPTRRCIDAYAERGDAEVRRALVHAVRQGVLSAHMHILEQSQSDGDKRGMGTTFTGFLVAGGDAVFAHAGDSRAYLIRDDIAIRLSEDHTLLSRLEAAGIDWRQEGGDPNRWKGVLTNALGMGGDTRVVTFLLSLASGDRIVLCTDGVHEYLDEAEIGQVLERERSPALAAKKLVDIALERGGADNATAVVVKVVEAGETKVPPEQRLSDQRAIEACPLFEYLTPLERLRGLRIALPWELRAGEAVPAVALGEPVAHIVLAGEARIGDAPQRPGALIYPQALVRGAATPERDALAQASTPMRLLTIRRDDFLEITEEEAELGVKMYAVLAKLMAR